MGIFAAMVTDAALALVICSVKPRMAAEAAEAARQTAGVPVEAIVMDNRALNEPIARIYNRGARQARAPRLVFMHEDVTLLGEGWGRRLVELLDRHDTGAVGPAGSVLWVPAPSGWWQDERYVATAVSQLERHNGVERRVTLPRGPLPEGGCVRAATLDGLLLAVRRDVWEQHPFDEKALRGFHCYDLDFTVGLAAAGLQNYVMDFGELLHSSPGSFTAPWAEATLTLYEHKWRNTGAIDYSADAAGEAPGQREERHGRIALHAAYDTAFKTMGLKGEAPSSGPCCASTANSAPGRVSATSPPCSGAASPTAESGLTAQGVHGRGRLTVRRCYDDGRGCR